MQLYGAAAKELCRVETAVDKGSMALSGRKFPASDRQMSSRITAPAHTVRAVVFSSVQRGLAQVGMDSSRG
jgi:hypothetical protein